MAGSVSPAGFERNQELKLTYSSFDQLLEKVRESASRRKVAAVVAAEDLHTLEAVIQAEGEGILSAILIGQAGKIREGLRALERNQTSYEIVEAEEPREAAAKAAELVRNGAADFVMKGRIQTADLLSVLFSADSGMRTGKLMSHLAIVQIPNYHKLIGLTDVAINIAPTLPQKKEIVENAVAAMSGMGFEAPKIALLSASEAVNPKIAETVEAAELAKLNREGWLAPALVEGPISYDLAMSRESAEIKKYDSPLCGDVDLLVVSNMPTGNILLKALRYSANASSAGIVVGGRVPIVLTSRAVETQDKFLPLVLAASASGG